ncbi:MAG: hypothetical protein ACYTF1_27515 [Planctomycetota bacterium]|jgi:hypothetical protein
MKFRLGIIILAAFVLIALSASPVMAGEQAIVQRELDNAFVDTFLLDVDPIRFQMPANWDDYETDLVAGTRVDNLDAVKAGGPYATIEDMLFAFYNNQDSFNNDPDRNQIEMNGTVREVIEADGTVLVIANIAYQDLPLTLYDQFSFYNIFATFDLSKLVTILEDGTLNGLFYVEMEIPYPGAPLHFWNSYVSRGVRRWRFVGEGEGWLVDESGERTGRAKVHIHQDCEIVLLDITSCSKKIVEYTPIS